MKKLVLVPAFLVCGFGGAALAQTTEVPAPPPPGAVVPAERGAVNPVGSPPLNQPDNPNATGDDKFNGLEVPRMKDPREGGRDQ